MIFSGWIALVVISLWLSLIAFVWALGSGQFSDQDRARYLALAGDSPGEERDPAPENGPTARRRGAGVLVLIAVLALGVFTLAVVLSLSGIHGAG